MGDLGRTPCFPGDLKKLGQFQPARAHLPGSRSLRRCQSAQCSSEKVSLGPEGQNRDSTGGLQFEVGATIAAFN